MLKGDRINGYTILRDFSVAGGGQSKWSLAKRGKRTFFIKEFLHPAYPTEESPGSVTSKEHRRIRCDAFEEHHNKIRAAIAGRCARGGNLVYTIDFFRHGSKYYKVTDYVDISPLDISDIASLPLTKRLLLLKTMTHSLQILHKANIVHGDLKPANILIKAKDESFIAKLIDFDNSFFSQHPPRPDEIVGDMVFYSPEYLRFVKRDEKVDGRSLTTRSDVFALGLIFSLCLTGSMPNFPRTVYNYPCEAVNAGENLTLEPSDLPGSAISLIEQTLTRDHSKRPTTGHVFHSLKKLSLEAAAKEAAATAVTKTETRLKGKGLSIRRETEPVDEKGRSSTERKPAPTEAATRADRTRSTEKPRLKGKLMEKP